MFSGETVLERTKFAIDILKVVCDEIENNNFITEQNRVMYKMRVRTQRKIFRLFYNNLPGEDAYSILTNV